jgi:hypothetical protein
MSDALERARETQIVSLETLTGRPLDELLGVVAGWGPGKHGELLRRAKEAFGLTHGHANFLVHLARERSEAGVDAAVGGAAPDPLAQIYAGSKASLRPLHEALMARLAELGPFEVAPKKAYLSLRRSKQFAMVGPGSRGRLEVGINHRGAAGTERLEALPPGGMCSHRVFVMGEDEIDDDLVRYLRDAYEAAG